MAWIYKRGSKWWMGERSQDGKLIQKSLKTKIKAEAEAELEKTRLVQSLHSRGAATEDVIAVITGKQVERKKTVVEYFKGWLDTARPHVTGSTIKKYEQLSREFIAFVKADIMPLTMDDIKADQVRGFLTEKRKTTTHATTSGFRRILSGIFLQAQNEGQTTRNPVALAKLPKVLTKENGKRAFTLAEVKQLYGKATPFWKWMIRSAFYTGFSLGDLVTLRRRAADMRQRMVSINRRKTGKAVNVPMNAGLIELFKATWPAKADDYFWPDEAQKYLTTGASSFSQEFYELMAECGMVTARDGTKETTGKGRNAKRSATGLGFHGLRHTFVTNLKIAGAQDSVAKELAGHGSSAVSAVYTHLPVETLSEAVKRIPTL